MDIPLLPDGDPGTDDDDDDDDDDAISVADDAMMLY